MPKKPHVESILQDIFALEMQFFLAQDLSEHDQKCILEQLESMVEFVKTHSPLAPQIDSTTE